MKDEDELFHWYYDLTEGEQKIIFGEAETLFYERIQELIDDVYRKTGVSFSYEVHSEENVYDMINSYPEEMEWEEASEVLQKYETYAEGLEVFKESLIQTIQNHIK